MGGGGGGCKLIVSVGQKRKPIFENGQFSEHFVLDKKNFLGEIFFPNFFEKKSPKKHFSSKKGKMFLF